MYPRLLKTDVSMWCDLSHRSSRHDSFHRRRRVSVQSCQIIFISIGCNRPESTCSEVANAELPGALTELHLPITTQQTAWCRRARHFHASQTLADDARPSLKHHQKIGRAHSRDAHRVACQCASQSCSVNANIDVKYSEVTVHGHIRNHACETDLSVVSTSALLSVMRTCF